MAAGRWPLSRLVSVCGQVMDHLIAGERNPKVLAQLARGKARRKLGELEEALEGAEFFTVSTPSC
jgi:transposase